MNELEFIGIFLAKKLINFLLVLITWNKGLMGCILCA